MSFLIKPDLEELTILQTEQEIIEFLTPMCYTGLYQYLLPVRYKPDHIQTVAREMAEEIVKYIPLDTIDDDDFEATVDRNPVEMQRHALQHICRGSVSWSITHGAMATDKTPGSMRQKIVDNLQLLLAMALQAFLHPSILKALDPENGYQKPTFTNLT